MVGIRARQNITPSGYFASPAGVMPPWTDIRIIPHRTAAAGEAAWHRHTHPEPAALAEALGETEA